MRVQVSLTHWDIYYICWSSLPCFSVRSQFVQHVADMPGAIIITHQLARVGMNISKLMRSHAGGTIDSNGLIALLHQIKCGQMLLGLCEKAQKKSAVCLHWRDESHLRDVLAISIFFLWCCAKVEYNLIIPPILLKAFTKWCDTHIRYMQMKRARMCFYVYVYVCCEANTHKKKLIKTKTCPPGECQARRSWVHLV